MIQSLRPPEYLEIVDWETFDSDNAVLSQVRGVSFHIEKGVRFKKETTAV